MFKSHLKHINKQNIHMFFFKNLILEGIVMLSVFGFVISNLL